MTPATSGRPATSEHPAPPVVLRRMRWWDIAPVVVLERAAFPDDAWTAEMFWSELAERATRHYLVAERAVPGAPAVIGYAGVAVVGEESDLQTVAVAPVAQGSGLGRRLLDAVTEAAGTAGARVMHLEVRADNAPAISLYDSQGYRRTGRRRGYYRGPDGPVDALTMTRTLVER